MWTLFTMNLILDFFDDLSLPGLMEDQQIFKKTTGPQSPQHWPDYMISVTPSSAFYYRLKEYYRQVFTISPPNTRSHPGLNVIICQENVRPETCQGHIGALRKNGLPAKSGNQAEFRISSSAAENGQGPANNTCKAKRRFDDLSALRRQTVKLKNRLRAERKKNGELKRRWEGEFHRANRFERGKRETDAKLKKATDMIVRMRQILVTIEDENFKLKTNLEEAQRKLEEKEEDAEFLEASLHDTTKGKEKLEKELCRLLKDTADSEFKNLNEIHFALLRKTTPCVHVDIAGRFEPVVDDDNAVVTLGGGAFGRVCAYRQKRGGKPGRLVAMKILHATDDDYLVRRQEILLEARLLRLFTGTGVFPRMHAVGSLGSDFAIAMEFLGDDTNFQVLTLNTWTRESQVSVHNAKTVILDILCALKELHSLDILHNDIKGDNVIVKQLDHDLYSGYLIDLGNASTTFMSAAYDFGEVERDYYEDDPLSIHYAPELIFDNAATSTCTDIYQIGQLIYFIGEDIGNVELRDIANRCLYREPLSRITLLELIECVSEL